MVQLWMVSMQLANVINSIIINCIEVYMCLRDLLDRISSPSIPITTCHTKFDLTFLWLHLYHTQNFVINSVYLSRNICFYGMQNLFNQLRHHSNNEWLRLQILLAKCNIVDSFKKYANLIPVRLDVRKYIEMTYKRQTHPSHE